MQTVLSRDGTPIGYRQSGEGPPLVLVHGTGGTRTRWAAILPALEVHFRVYAIDRRGRGESGDAGEYAPVFEAQDIAAVVDSIHKPVCLLGHSFGAICALEAALLTPNLRKMVLYEPPIPTRGIQIHAQGIVDKLQALLDAGGREEALVAFYREVVRMPQHELDLIRGSPAWPARVAAAHTLPRELKAAEEYRFEPQRFRQLALPILLLLGADSPALFRTATDALAGALPHSRTVILPGQQHFAIDTAPALFAQEVVAFLSESD